MEVKHILEVKYSMEGKYILEVKYSMKVKHTRGKILYGCEIYSRGKI